jgi:hypothetical protein
MGQAFCFPGGDAFVSVQPWCPTEGELLRCGK